MRVDSIEIGYRLTFLAPFHFGTGLRQGLVDRIVARDVEDYLYVPGSTIKGALRERCGQLARLFGLTARSPHDVQAALAEFGPKTDLVARIFGSRFVPGGLYFDDARMVDEDRAYFDGVQERKRYLERQVQQRTRVGISRLTNSARPGLLFTSEFGVSPLRFEGQIYGRLRDFPLPGRPGGTYGLVLLLSSLYSLDKLGANTSSGAGRLKCEIAALKVNGESDEPAGWLASVADLEYYEIEDEGTAG